MAKPTQRSCAAAGDFTAVTCRLNGVSNASTFAACNNRNSLLTVCKHYMKMLCNHLIVCSAR